MPRLTFDAQPGSPSHSYRAEKDVSPLLSQVCSWCWLLGSISSQDMFETIKLIIAQITPPINFHMVDSLPSVTVPLGQDFTFRSVSPSSSLPASSNLFPPGIRLITGFLTLHGFVPLLLHLSLSLFNDWEFYFFVNYSLPLHSMKYIYFNKEFGNSGRETFLASEDALEVMRITQR